jgi:isoquinoline 1-oxidoreductase beta subunit
MLTFNTKDEQAAVSRRGFLQTLAAGSLMFAVKLTGAGEIIKVSSPDSIDDLGFSPDLFLAILPDGMVKIVAHRSEMGTGIRTALPMVVADELGADWNDVEIAQGIGSEEYGSQNTDGSRSIRRFYKRMQVAGATARTMLEDAAASRWGVRPSSVKTNNSKIVNTATGDEIGFGDLVEEARELKAPVEDSLKFKPRSEYKIVGTNVPLTDLEDIVTGHAPFGIDARKEGQLFAMIARSPVHGGSPKSYDADAAKAVNGVVDVIEIPGFEPPHAFQAVGGIAVLATSTWAAKKGRDALNVKWEAGANASFNSDEFETKLVEASQKDGKVWRSVGDTKKALSEADDANKYAADYYVPMLAHASMEPPCALAEVTKDDDGNVIACEAWAPVQNPQAGQAAVSATLGIEPDDVTINVTLLGGGFGRKSKPDFICEAAILARETDKPVHVTWTREDDLHHDYFHAPAAVHMEAAVDDNGMPTAVLARSAFPSITSTFAPGSKTPASWELGLGLSDLPYDVPNLQVQSGESDAHVRIGWLRSVTHIFHAFAAGSFPDELAHRAGKDPMEYNLALLGKARELDLEGVDYPNHREPLSKYPFDVGRLINVTEKVGEMANWGREMPKGRGLGLAYHRSFLSYCANIIEVDVAEDGTVTIPHAWVVIDAGMVVHPDRVVAQMEGAAAFSASLALTGEITATNGVIDQDNFHQYRLARITDGPTKVDVHIVESNELPAGVGEVGVPPFTPALTNAIFAATGKRIHRLPISKHNLAWDAS